jgi:hypothetical protein
MRRPRDFDSELRALSEKARRLQERKLRQFGELVIATGADALPIEQLVGALLAACDGADMMMKEEWRARGAAFFHRPRKLRSDTPSQSPDLSPRRGGEDSAPESTSRAN